MRTARFESASSAGDGWGATLDGLVAVHAAARIDEVVPVLARADEAARAGRWAAVVVAYEAAAAFEPALAGRIAPPVPGLPLAWVAVYERERPDSGEHGDPPERPAFEPDVDLETFAGQVRRAQEHIRAGDTYQVNLTFQMRGHGVPDCETLREAQRARYAAALDLGTHRVLSFSPELFFERRGEIVITRPMKGTAARGRWLAEDDALAAALRTSPKDRAENVMIVDLLRNDLGRVARPGSVRVPRLFTLERYPTVWQMTSTVEARVDPGTTLVDLFRALFPCGSVTGAPKIRTMEIIAALERQPRGLYTGAIGYVRPGGDCVFNVAIRTVVVDAESGASSMGIGAGITADSDPHREYAECLLKARFVTDPPAPARGFSLLETMRLERGTIGRLDRHLARMRDSAAYFGVPWDEARIRHALEDAGSAHQDGCWRVRLLLDAAGAPAVTCAEHSEAGSGRWRVAFATEPIDDRSPFVFNKTSRRDAYDAARSSRPGADDVLLWNERGEVTESTIANLVVELDGRRVTPPLACGLLPGVFRGELLERGEIHEQVLSRDDVRRARRIWLVNSLRGWIPAELVNHELQH